MRRFLVGLCVACGVLISVGGVVSAQTTPTFKLGFLSLAQQIPDVVGQPIDNEHLNLSNGNSEQQTTSGLMVWRKADNWTAFTDGSRTWINGPSGVQVRGNNEYLTWEWDALTKKMLDNFKASLGPPPGPAPAPTGYRYIDPRAIVSDTATYVGQKVALEGITKTVHHYNTPTSYSWIQFVAVVEGSDPMKTQTLVLRFYPKQGTILEGDAIKVLGTVTGTENTVFVQSGVPTTDAVIIGDSWEPW